MYCEQSVSYFSFAKLILQARLMYERQAAKPLGRQKFEIISLILTSLFVIVLAVIILDCNHSPFQVGQKISF